MASVLAEMEGAFSQIPQSGRSGLTGGIPDIKPRPLIPTIFHEPWWLDAASNKQWDEVVVEDGGRQVARFPFIVERGFAGSQRSTMPQLTHVLGPAIDAGTGNAVNRALKHYDRARRVIEKANKFGGAHHLLHRDFGDALPFQDANFKVGVQFTYVIKPDSIDAIWRGMRDKTRNVIRRAQERFEVVAWNDPGAFSAFYDRQLGFRGLDNYYSRVEQVIEAAIAHGQGSILSARSETGQTIAAIFVVWDQNTAYYLMTARDPEADNGVVSLLISKAIEQAAQRNLTFDFDGVAFSGARVFYNGFGGKVDPRYVVTRYRDPRWLIGFKVAGLKSRISQTSNDR